MALAGIVAGAVGIVLGASLASLLGLYLAAAAMVVTGARAAATSAAARSSLTLAIGIAVTAGTYWRAQAPISASCRPWFGPPPETPGQYAASWSQRLIFAYIGGRVFLDQPVLGTGW